MKYKLLLSIALSVLFLGCEKPANSSKNFKVQSSLMTESEISSFDDALAKLDTVMSEKAPLLHGKFAPGATDEDIAQLREALGGHEITSLEAWFRWHNGPKERFLGLVPLGEVVSIKQAIEYRESLSMAGASLRGSSVMIMEDGAGDGYFLDITSDPPRVFYEMMEDPYPTYYGSLPEFVDFIIKGFSSEVFSEDAKGWFVEDEDRFEAFEKNYLDKHNKH
ncbi:SMI1/KNR4 family protein [Persicirhabdus sediminis]|uniref:SMI1/KNR4 family protein n=1 Tax=Persicirhabdus sediminis TaxID=454144 RepID=A0A8J7MCL7_9BACT|nr:SMI1/KNR4 family protein [Persicirhabdus sediminis]MBK1790051.1 SMI1/KNR4 family protein [Persicirhabdus sediminis]